ncbi:hypothetical protein NUU61_002035 [Penicillium alfredii]|uniref:Purple acid phosphatase n=1 Tax=Penicillium alfredii TaxID=1506179 RepID=A0A9W9FQY6_9EURO|nr:uncharacterized protein NUU61_002035 [Penicillium alfredii]KAJ5104688.1 hypothetical protein NUU61_002035 [Penicillium alfredii]
MAAIVTFTKLLQLAVSIGSYHHPPIPEDKTTPFQQRLSIHSPTGKPKEKEPLQLTDWVKTALLTTTFPSTEVSVGWNTYGSIDHACVEYGKSEHDLSSKACASSKSTTYPTSRTHSNTVTLTDLHPATTYYYKIVSDNSSVDHFLSPRTPGDDTPFNISVVVDLGVYGGDGYTHSEKDKDKRDTRPNVNPALDHATIGRLADTVDDYELVIHPGDFAYADDWARKYHNKGHGKDAYQGILEQFYGQLAPIAGRKPYMTSPGNHEAACKQVKHAPKLCPEGQSNFTDFMHRFSETMPRAFDSASSSKTAQEHARKARDLSQPPFWYSFEYGMAHIVMINTETDFTDAPDGTDGNAKLDGGPFGAPHQQLDFLAADLASVDRRVTPWLIVAGHRPWYTTGKGKSCKPCQKAFEKLFHTYGVDLAVFGHVHNSQRFFPVYDGKADPKGMHNPTDPMYIISGGTGNIEGLDPVHPQPSYTAWAYADDQSYSTLNFLDKHRLEITFVQSATGKVLDSSVLHKDHSTSFVKNS